VPVHGADPDTSRAGHVGHLHVVASFGEQSAGRRQDATTVAFRIGAGPLTGRRRSC
jgi:hypothetical protein